MSPRQGRCDVDTGAGTGFAVNRDNVLRIGGAFAVEAKRMQDRLDGYRERMITSPALGDPASADFADALNRRLVLDDDSYVNRAQGYVDELVNVAEQCAAAALAYGHTEDDVESMMRGLGGSLA
jgi:hypothetical protein